MTQTLEVDISSEHLQCLCDFTPGLINTAGARLCREVFKKWVRISKIYRLIDNEDILRR